MTLILAMGNQHQVVLVSDRRISRGGQIVTLPDELERDESNKAFVLNLRDARLAVAFAGIASNGKGFLTKRWLPEALMDTASPDFLMGLTIQRFAQRATRDFERLSVAPSLDKSLSVVFAGYCYDEIPPRCYSWLVSNFEDPDGTMLAKGKPVTEFQYWVMREKRPAEEARAFFRTIGGGERAVSQDSQKSIIHLLLQEKPPHALVGKAVEVIRQAAKSDRSKNTVGKQCSSIVLPSNPNENAIGEYHSAKLARSYYLPTYIEARGGESGVYTVAEPMYQVRNSNDQPLPLPVRKVGRNHQCPCGSSKKYKKCHGSVLGRNET